MATLPYSERSDTYAARTDAESGDRPRDVGATIFVWLAWALAAVFWGFSLTTGIGIVEALGRPADGLDPGEADVGGIGWMTINFFGAVIVLGGALAYGLYRYATRDRRLDPMTEASTAALYDSIERQGGDDMTSRSPDEHKPTERDAYRAAQRDLH